MCSRNLGEKHKDTSDVFAQSPTGMSRLWPHFEQKRQGPHRILSSTDFPRFCVKKYAWSYLTQLNRYSLYSIHLQKITHCSLSRQFAFASHNFTYLSSMPFRPNTVIWGSPTRNSAKLSSDPYHFLIRCSSCKHYT